MNFVIKNKEGKGCCATNHESCIPISSIDSLDAAGYQFYLDGAKISAHSLKLKFAHVVPPEIAEYSSEPVQDSDITTHLYGDTRDNYPVEVCNRSTSDFGKSKEDSSNINVAEIDVSSGVDSTSCEDTEVVVEDFQIDLSSLNFSINSRTVVCLNNGKVYKTQKAAGEDLNIDPVNISYSITSGRSYKGYIFKKALEYIK